MAVKMPCKSIVVELLDVTDNLCYKKDKLCTTLTLRHVHVTTVAVEKQ